MMVVANISESIAHLSASRAEALQAELQQAVMAARGNPAALADAEDELAFFEACMADAMPMQRAA